jgi:hypothetical protein
VDVAMSGMRAELAAATARDHACRGGAVVAVSTLVRALVIALVLGLASTAAASPYDVSWASFRVGLGTPPKLGGELGDRSESTACGNGRCPLSARFAIGGGFGRYGVELHISSAPFEDATAKDYRDRSRHAFLWGPQARFSAFRRWGFDVSVRAGLQHGGLDGDESTTRPSSCNADVPHSCDSMSYEPPSYPVWAMSGGITLSWRVRFSGGYFGIQADVDVTGIRAMYPDGAVYGTVATRTFGIVMGSMFDTK